MCALPSKACQSSRIVISNQRQRNRKVFQTINTEPTGFAFNSIMNMEINHRKHPMNPFVNAGAIATTSLIAGKDADENLSESCHL